MKVCVNCGKEVPDSALHCVFCGGRQPVPRAVQKTLLGHGDLAEELLRRQTEQAVGADGDSADDVPARADGVPADAPMGDTGDRGTAEPAKADAARNAPREDADGSESGASPGDADTGAGELTPRPATISPSPAVDANAGDDAGAAAPADAGDDAGAAAPADAGDDAVAPAPAAAVDEAGWPLSADELAADDTAYAMTQVDGTAYRDDEADRDAAHDAKAGAENEADGGRKPAGTRAGHDLEDAVSRAIEIADRPAPRAPTATSAPPATRPTTKTPPAATPVHERAPMPAAPDDLAEGPDPFSATQPLSRSGVQAIRTGHLDVGDAPAVAPSPAPSPATAPVEPPTATTSAPSAAATTVDPTAATVEGQAPAELPPFLASETHTRHNAPVEPYARRTRNQLLAFGALLMLGILLPWEAGPQGTRFVWHALAASGGTALFAGALIASAIAALALGLIRLPAGPRGLGALACGAAPIAALSIGLLEGPATAGVTLDSGPATFCLALGLLLLASGLLVRSQYRAAVTGRALATAGALLTAIALLVPAGDGGSVLTGFADRVADAGGRAKPSVVMGAAPLLLAAFGLLAWAPTGVSFGASILAWVVILWFPLAQILTVLGASTSGSVASLYHGPLALTAWYALASYGVATVAGKQLEHE